MISQTTGLIYKIQTPIDSPVRELQENVKNESEKKC